MTRKCAFLLSVIMTLSNYIIAQGTTNTGRKVFYGINTIHTAINSIQFYKMPPSGYRQFKISPIDKIVPLTLNKKVARVSDLTFLGTVAITSAAILVNKSKNDRYIYGLRKLENLWVTYNITESLKNNVKRMRPYAYSAGISKKDDFRSFVSGHSSLTASLATSLWLSKPKNKVLPIIASALSISTAALRIKAGKHFTSDVLAGMAIGVGVSLLHQKISPVGR